MHGLTGNRRRALKLHLAHVARGHGAHFVDHVHQHLSAVGREPRAGHGVVGEHLFAVHGGLDEAHRILDVADAFGATHHHGLKKFGGHHRTHARTACRAVHIIHDGGVQAPGFGRAAHAGNADLRILVLGVQRFVRRPDRLTPEVVGRHQFGLFVLEVQVDRTVGLALKNDHVPASVLDLVANKAA